MNLKQRFTEQKTWIKGGIIGIAICTIMFFVYPLVYFPLVENDIGLPNSAMILPTTTGHVLPMFMHFIIEGSSIPGQICTETKTECAHWSLAYEEGGVPWDDSEGGAGYCLEVVEMPLSSCTDRVEAAASILSIALLEALYFIIGAGIAVIIQQRKKQA